HPGVTDLAAPFAVKRRARRDDLAPGALLQPLDDRAGADQGEHLGGVLVALVTGELDSASGDALERGAVDPLHRLLGATELRALAGLVERLLIAARVHVEAALGADHLRQIEGETEGIVELERGVSGQHALAAR